MLHVGLKLRIDHSLIADRIVAEVNGFRCVLVNCHDKILINLLCHERDHRSGELGNRNKACVQSHIGIDLILLHALCPEAAAAAADIPVGQVVNKCLKSLAGFRNSVICHIVIDSFDRCVQSGQDPLVDN